MATKFCKAKLIEVLIKDGTSRYQLSDNPIFRNSHIKAIQVPRVGGNDAGSNIDRTIGILGDLVSEDLIRNSYITVKDNSKTDIIEDMPLVELEISANQTNLKEFEHGITIDCYNTYITVPAALATTNTGKYLQFIIYYQPK